MRKSKIHTHDGEELEIIEDKPKRKPKPVRKRRALVFGLVGLSLVLFMGVVGLLMRTTNVSEACPGADCQTAHTVANNTTRWQPALCPEILGASGDKIALTAQLRGSDQPEMFVMDAEGRNLCPLITESLSISSPSWSPDGRWIAFHLVTQDRHDANHFYRDLHLFDLANGDTMNLTYDIGTATSVDWSPTGGQLVFVGGSGGQTDLYMIDADSSNLARLTEYQSFIERPAWSPDGRWIAFVSAHDHPDTERNSRNSYEIYLMDVQNGSTRRLTNNMSYDHMPAWSPDGSKLVFVSSTSPDSNTHTDLFVMETICAPTSDDCTATRQNITQNGYANQAPVWLSDGQRIAYIASERSGDRGLYVIDIETGHIRRLTRPSVHVADFDWWLASSLN